MRQEYSNLDLLRSFAVLSVVVCHVANFFTVNPRLQSLGVFGVTLFFVHTAMVLMQSLGRQQQDDLCVPFFIRRFFRIYPVATLVTCLAVLLHVPQGVTKIGHILPIRYDIGTVLYNLTLTQRFFTIVPSIVRPEWSLSYEVEMYMVLPVLYILIKDRRSVRVPIVYLGLLAISFLLCLYYPYETRLSFLSIFSFVPCFAAGMVAYHLQKESTRKFSAIYWLAVLVLLCTAVICNVFSALGGFQWWAVAAIVGFSVPYFEQFTCPLVVQVCKLISKYSYGIYLSHYFCIWVAFEKMSPYPLVARVAVFCLMLVTLPALLYHTIEQPFIEYGKRIVATRITKTLPLDGRCIA